MAFTTFADEKCADGSTDNPAVLVAKDVLKHLHAYKLGTGHYLRASKFLPPGDNLFEMTEALTGECKVCALGACLLSRTRLFQDVSLGAVYNTHAYFGTNVSYDYVKANLSDVFDEQQLAMIEAAFEMKVVHWGFPGRPAKTMVLGAVAFGKQYPDERKRVRAVMENIIHHGGVFVVEPASDEDVARWEFGC